MLSLLLLAEEIPLLPPWLLFMNDRPGERTDMEATDSSSSSWSPGREEYGELLRLGGRLVLVFTGVVGREETGGRIGVDGG